MKLFTRFCILFIVTNINILINNRILPTPNLENICSYKPLINEIDQEIKNQNNNTLKKIAYHETGHALIVHLFKQYFTIDKVTIKQNNYGNDGFTLFTLNDYYINYPTKKYLLANMIVTMGGHAAEIILLNSSNKRLSIYNEQQLFSFLNNDNITIYSDLMQANNIADQYIKLYGIDNGKLKSIIEMEHNLLINYAYNKAINLLINNKKLLIKTAEDLLRYNTLNYSYFDNVYCDYF